MFSRLPGETKYETTAAPIPPITVVHTGEVAKTGPRVERWLAWSERERKNFAEASTDCTSQFVTDPVDALSRYGSLLSDATVAAGIDYMTDNHLKISSLATKFGGAAKPSGAGGGDIALAIIPDSEQRKLFVEACQVAHFPVIPLSICKGVSVESEL